MVRVDAAAHRVGMTHRPEFPAFPFTWSTAKTIGITRRRLDDAVRCREIRRLTRGVYLRSDVELTTEVRVAALALVLPPCTVVGDRTAAWIYGIDVLEYREHDVPPPLETYALRGRSRTGRPECTGSQRDLRPEDICIVQDVPVTTPLRTCMDLGCQLSRRRALAAMDAFMRKFGITRAQMIAMLPRYFRRRGVVQLRELVMLADPRAESARESWTRLEIADAGLPAPEPQHWIVVGGRPTYRLDLAYPHAKVAVEYDGREFHDNDEQRKADAERRRWLRDHGWIVIVLDQDSFAPGAVDLWLHELAGALRLAA
jgi:hypothetical protein